MTTTSEYSPRAMSWKLILTVIEKYKGQMSVVERAVMVKYLKVLKERVYNEDERELRKMLRQVYDMLDGAMKEGKL